MTRPAFFLAALASILCLLAAPIAQAAPAVGTISQLSGLVMAIKPDGRPRILSAASRVEVGDTLVSEADSYVRVALADGSQAVLGPLTTLKVASFSPRQATLVLAGGQVQVSGAAQQPPGHRFTLEAGETTITVGAARFTASYSVQAPPAQALRQAYLRNSLAAAATGPATDAADDLPLRQVVAQLPPKLPQTGFGMPPGAPPRPGGPTLAPGLHVSVLDGTIAMTNSGGSVTFSSGQFGYVRSNSTPPIMVPNNPGLNFTPPPTFTMGNTNPTNSASQPGTVDCEVR